MTQPTKGSGGFPLVIQGPLNPTAHAVVICVGEKEAVRLIFADDKLEYHHNPSVTVDDAAKVFFDYLCSIMQPQRFYAYKKAEAHAQHMDELVMAARKMLAWAGPDPFGAWDEMRAILAKIEETQP